MVHRHKVRRALKEVLHQSQVNGHLVCGVHDAANELAGLVSHFINLSNMVPFFCPLTLFNVSSSQNLDKPFNVMGEKLPLNFSTKFHM